MAKGPHPQDVYHLHHLRYQPYGKLGENEWYYSPIDGCVVTRMKVAAALPFQLSIPVCAPLHPRPYRYPVRRVQESLWYLSPSQYVPETAAKNTWSSRMKPFHPSLGTMFLALTNAPEKVETLLDGLEVVCAF